MKFCAVINCIDGRVQLPVIEYLKKRFEVEAVDNITEAGPSLILAEQANREAVQSILDRLEISLDRHDSVGVAIVGHHDCAGNPASAAAQIKHLQRAIRFLQERYAEVTIIGLWVNDQWTVQEITQDITAN